MWAQTGFEPWICTTLLLIYLVPLPMLSSSDICRNFNFLFVCKLYYLSLQQPGDLEIIVNFQVSRLFLWWNNRNSRSAFNLNPLISKGSLWKFYPPWDTYQIFPFFEKKLIQYYTSYAACITLGWITINFQKLMKIMAKILVLKRVKRSRYYKIICSN